MIKAKIKNPDIKIFCDVTRCIACKTCELACAVEHSNSKELLKSMGEKPKKRIKVEALDGRSISLLCQHCKDAPCVTACISGALFKDEKSGATLHNKEKCIGCWMCVMVCPFGAIVRDIESHVAVKCDLCPDREDYACVSSCPTKALFVGTKKEFENYLKNRKGAKK